MSEATGEYTVVQDPTDPYPRELWAPGAQTSFVGVKSIFLDPTKCEVVYIMGVPGTSSREVTLTLPYGVLGEDTVTPTRQEMYLRFKDLNEFLVEYAYLYFGRLVEAGPRVPNE